MVSELGGTSSNRGRDGPCERRLRRLGDVRSVRPMSAEPLSDKETTGVSEPGDHQSSDLK